MNDEHDEALASAAAELKRLKKRVSYWKGRATGERNRRWRLAYLKATQPESDEAFLICETMLNNCLVQADNYDAISRSEVASLRRAEEHLTTLQRGASGGT
jgi:hypothetical protein